MSVAAGLPQAIVRALEESDQARKVLERHYGKSGNVVAGADARIRDDLDSERVDLFLRALERQGYIVTPK
jgi:hypothetical protein